MTKERIEIIRQSLIPFVKKELLEINYEDLGKSDAKEFEKDLNEVLDLAIKALEQPSGVENLLKQVYEQKRWLSYAGYNAYNVDIAFKSIIGAIQNMHITVSDDCLSRKAMLNAITEIDNNVNMDIYTNEVREIIKALPPVTPTHGTCKDCKKYRNSLEHCTQWAMPTNDDFYCADYEKAR